MIAGILLSVVLGVAWWFAEGAVAWLLGAACIFFAAAVINGFRSEEEAKSSSPKNSNSSLSGNSSVRVDSSSATKIEGDGNYSFNIVGESHYQDALIAIAGAKEEKSKRFKCEAFIVHEPNNPHDKNACAVVIGDQRVGYLSKQDAKDQVLFRNSEGFILKADAMIVGGWSLKGSEGCYGVKIDYIPRELPAKPLEKEIYSFVGQRVPRGLTRQESWNFERSLAESKHEKAGQWKEFKSAVEYLQSSEGREEYDIKKPSLKKFREAYANLVDERDQEGDSAPIEQGEICDRVVDLFPDLEKS
jgi:hypothetical protein